MDNSSSTTTRQAQPVVRKGKKKQVKDETDRIKQAEKKKRRIEKAIATSAAIRAELEKKKQKKKEGQQEAEADEENSADAAKKEKQERDELERTKQAEKKKIRVEKSIAASAAIRAELEKKKLKRLEEQRRLEEEGAVIAEAVALHVLLGEDCDDSYRIMLNQETGFKAWDYKSKFNVLTGGRNRLLPDHRCLSYAVHSNWSVPYEPFARGWDNNNMGVSSADLVAAQAVSSLQISENADVDAIVFNEIYSKF